MKLFLLVLLTISATGFGFAMAQEPEFDRPLIGRQIARAALIDYRFQAEPDPADARIAADLLELAAGYRPDDPIVLRYAIEAHRAAGDEQAVIDATKRLVRLDPGDEVAQLRLISWSISRKQTVEDRLAAYAQWLDGKGSDFLKDSPAIASRLALDAALLHREVGDERAFVGRLAQASRLDSSNKEAATLSAAIFAQRSDDPVGRLELAINVLLADPIDPNVHLSIAEQLAAHGDFAGARRFYNNAARLIRLAGGDADTPAMVEALTALDWYAASPAAVLNAFETQLRTMRANAERTRERLIELGQPLDGVRSPDDIRLDQDRERFRLYAAILSNDRVAAERSITDMDATVKPVLERISDRLGSLGADEQEARIALVTQGLQLGTASVTSRLLADVQSRTAAENLAQLQQTWGDRLGDQLGVLIAAAELRTGDPAQAALDLQPFAERTVLGAVFYGIALELQGRNDEALEQFERAATGAPLNSLGVFAFSKAQKLRGGTATESDLTMRMRETAAAVPAWIDRATAGPQSFMRLSATLEQQSVSAIGETAISIELRNLLPRPIAMGGDRPINSRLAVIPRVDVASYPLKTGLTPEVIDIHRKLRLESGQSFRTRVWPDAGMLGLLTEIKAGHRVSARFNVMQGFVVADGAPFKKGPFSLSAETKLLSRSPAPEASFSGEDLIRYAQTAPEPRILQLLPVYRAALLDVDLPNGQISSSDASALASALAGRYPSFGKDLRAAIIAVMPSIRLRPEMEAIDRATLAETDADLLKLALITRVLSPTASALERAAESPDAGLAGFAGALRSRLEGAQPNGYAFLTIPPSHKPKADESDG